MNHKVSKRIYSIHKWGGLIAGIFIFMLGISGSILVFHEELEAWEHNTEWTVSNTAPVQIDKAYQTIISQYKNYEIRLPRFSNNPQQTLIFNLRRPEQRLTIFAHPSKGSILKVIDSNTTIVSWILTFHYSLHANLFGEIVVLIFGLIFFISLITGCILYRKTLINVLLFRIKFRHRNKRSIASSLHRYIGVWALLLNLIIVISGLFIIYDIVSRGIKKENSQAPLASPEIDFSIDKSLQAISRKYPAFHASFIRFPLSKEKPVIINGTVDGQAFYYSRYYNSVSIASPGTIGELKQANAADGATKLSSIVRAIHFIEYGNLPVKLLFCLAGLSAPALSITGFLLWKWKRKKKVF
jgi:uncharacterized iron-regulated membrane protein